MSTRSTRRRPAGNQGPRPWQPMRKAARIIPPELAAAAAADPEMQAIVDEVKEVWRNDRYVCHVKRREDGSVESLSIRRADRKASHDWREFQQIKHEIAGEDVEAFELYPARDRTMDTANQYWLWCLPPGQRIEAGFRGRAVEEDTHVLNARQRPFAKGMSI